MATKKQKAAALAELLARKGRLTPSDLVDEARSTDHACHEDFPWDNDVAAHQHRLNVARRLISSIRVTIVTPDRQVSTVAYVRDPNAGAHEQGYVSVAGLVDQAEKASEALLREVERVTAAYERAREFAAAVGLTDELEVAIRSALALRSRLRRGRATEEVRIEA